MKKTHQPLIVAVALAAALALGGCGKKDDSSAQIPATPSPESTAPATLPTTMAPAPEASAAMLSVSEVQLGSKVDDNHKIAVSSDSFAPKDNIYAAVDTSGHGSGTLAAKWTYQDGQTVHEDSKMLDASGAQTTVFMISKPSGFPVGNYKVDVSLDGKSVTSKDFAVK